MMFLIRHWESFITSICSFSSHEADLVLAVITVCPRTSGSPSPPGRTSVQPPGHPRSVGPERCDRQRGFLCSLMQVHRQRPSERSRCRVPRLCPLCK